MIYVIEFKCGFWIDFYLILSKYIKVFKKIEKDSIVSKKTNMMFCLYL